MNRVRRLVVAVAMTAAAVAGTVGVVGVRPAGAAWACAGARQVDLGACVDNPLPERLPTP